MLCGFRRSPALASFADANLLKQTLQKIVYMPYVHVCISIKRNTAVILLVKGGAYEK